MPSGATSISACIVCRNEADRLGPCLDSVRWADEIVLLDLGSEDGSADLARAAGARVVSHAPVPIVETVRNVVAEARAATGSSRSTPTSASRPAWRRSCAGWPRARSSTPSWSRA